MGTERILSFNDEDAQFALLWGALRTLEHSFAIHRCLYTYWGCAHGGVSFRDLLEKIIEKIID